MFLGLALAAGVLVALPYERSSTEPRVEAASEGQPAPLRQEVPPPDEKPIPTTTSTTAAPTTTVTTLPPTTTTEAPAPVTTQSSTAPTSPVTAAGAAGRNWDAVAQCESGGNWHINTGNGYYGGLQFNLQTWRGVGGPGYPHEHSRETQIHYAEILYSQRGAQPWPHCGKYL